MAITNQGLRKCFAEFIGTFALVFAGTGAIIINDVSGGVIGHVGIALTFGLVIMVMIYALGDISGAHFNPAVSTGFWLAKKMSLQETLSFILSQVAGAFAATGLLRILFPQHATLGTTLPNSVTTGAPFILEVILTFFLMFVIIQVSTGAKEKGLMAGIAIGGTIALDALFGGPMTGASMNPARSLAPAIVSGHYEFLWIYLTAPFLGAAMAVGSWRLLRQEH